MVTSEPTAVGMVEQVVRVMGTPVPSDLQSDTQEGSLIKPSAPSRSMLPAQVGLIKIPRGPHHMHIAANWVHHIGLAPEV